MRWYRRLIAQKFDGSKHRRHLGRPRVSEEVEQLIVRMAEENPTWGYRRLQGALSNLGYHIDKITVRNILRRHHIDPAPKRRQAGMSWSTFLVFVAGVLQIWNFRALFRRIRRMRRLSQGASGEMLRVYFDAEKKKIRNVYLEGEAKNLYEGRLTYV